jgi:hypothetical protein
MEVCSLDSSGSGQVQTAGFWLQGIEPLCCTKMRGMSEAVEEFLAFEGRKCCNELVS